LLQDRVFAVGQSVREVNIDTAQGQRQSRTGGRSPFPLQDAAELFTGAAVGETVRQVFVGRAVSFILHPLAQCGKLVVEEFKAVGQLATRRNLIGGRRENIL
jgi:hypothetical protein